MHTEHLQNVRPSWVAFGWFIGAAFTSLIVIALIAVGILSRDGTGGAGWGVPAIFLGFLGAGYMVGARAGAAPILHAIGIGLFSVVVWFLANLLFGGPLGAETWNVSPAVTAGGLLLQIVAAAIGARLGSREARAAAAPAS